MIGPNGAGKTTFVNQLTGVLQPTSGQILFEGQDITEWTVRRRATAGISRTFQINQLFAELSPLESVVLAINESPNFCCLMSLPRACLNPNASRFWMWWRVCLTMLRLF